MVREGLTKVVIDPRTGKRCRMTVKNGRIVKTKMPGAQMTKSRKRLNRKRRRLGL